MVQELREVSLSCVGSVRKQRAGKVRHQQPSASHPHYCSCPDVRTILSPIFQMTKSDCEKSSHLPSSLELLEGRILWAGSLCRSRLPRELLGDHCDSVIRGIPLGRNGQVWSTLRRSHGRNT